MSRTARIKTKCDCTCKCVVGRYFLFGTVSDFGDLHESEREKSRNMCDVICAPRGAFHRRRRRIDFTRTRMIEREKAIKRGDRKWHLPKSELDRPPARSSVRPKLARLCIPVQYMARNARVRDHLHAKKRNGTRTFKRRRCAQHFCLCFLAKHCIAMYATVSVMRHALLKKGFVLPCFASSSFHCR